MTLVKILQKKGFKKQILQTKFHRRYFVCAVVLCEPGPQYVLEEIEEFCGQKIGTLAGLRVSQNSRRPPWPFAFVDAGRKFCF